MKDNFKIMRKEKVLVPFLYFLIALYILLPAFLSPGIFVGGDWAFARTEFQNKLQVQNIIAPWKTNAFIGRYESIGPALPILVINRIFYLLGISGALIAKLFIFALYFLAGYGVYLLLRYFKIARTSSFIAGFFYLTAPFVFNFTIIGWVYLLLSLSLLPLFLYFYMSAVREKSWIRFFISFLIFSIAAAGSTGIVWYSLAVGSLIFTFYKDKKLLKRYFSFTVISYLLLVLANSHWLLNLFLFKDEKVFGSNNVLSSVSRGMWLRFKLSNIVRGWGSVFNYSYESSYLPILVVISFIILLLVVYSLIFVKKEKVVSKLTLISLGFYPFALLFLGSYRLSKLPMANIIRDPGRNVALISFVTALLLGLLLNYWQEKNGKLFLITVILIVINAHPFLLWSMYSEGKEVENIKIRNYKYPQDYIDLENFLVQNDINSKVLSVPITGSSQDFSDPGFYGEYKGFSSAFDDLTPVQGSIKINDKERDGSNVFYQDFSRNLYQNFDNSIEQILKKIDLGYIIFKFDKMTRADWNLYDKIADSEHFFEITKDSLGYQSKRIAIFKVREPSSEVKITSNYIFTNEERPYIFDPLLDYLKNYELIYKPNISVQDQHPLLVFPKRYYSVDLTNIKPPNFALPKDVKQPSNLLPYKMVLRKDAQRVKNAINYQQAFDLLLENNSKRLAETLLYPESDITIAYHEYIDNYVQIKNVMEEVPLEQRDLSYFLLLQDLYTHLNYSEGVFEKLNFKEYKGIDYSDKTRGLVSDYRNWLFKNSVLCNGICYYFNEDVSDLKLAESNLKDLETIDSLVVEGSNNKETSIYQLDSQNDVLISYQDFLNQKIYLPDEDDPNLELRDLLYIVTYALKDTGKENFVEEMNNVVYFKVDKTIPSLNYEFVYEYLGEDSQIGIAIIEEYAELEDTYTVGAKKDNYLMVNRFAYFLESTNPEKIDENTYRVSRILQSDENTNRFYVLLFNAYKNSTPVIKDFNFGIKKLPVIYYQNNIPETQENPQYEFQKATKMEYLVSLKQPINKSALILNQRYHSGWELQTIDGEKISAQHFIANGYANSWIIDDEIPKEFKIIFKPSIYSKIGLQITVATYSLIFVCIAGLVIVKVTNDRTKKR